MIGMGFLFYITYSTTVPPRDVLSNISSVTFQWTVQVLIQLVIYFRFYFMYCVHDLVGLEKAFLLKDRIITKSYKLRWETIPTLNEQ